MIEPCVSDWQSYQVPDLRSDAVCNTIETAVLRQGLAICVAGASDIKDIEVTQVPHKVLLKWLQKVTAPGDNCDGMPCPMFLPDQPFPNERFVGN